jgi:hypothetical protein
LCKKRYSGGTWHNLDEGNVGGYTIIFDDPFYALKLEEK